MERHHPSPDGVGGDLGTKRSGSVHACPCEGAGGREDRGRVPAETGRGRGCIREG